MDGGEQFADDKMAGDDSQMSVEDDKSHDEVIKHKKNTCRIRAIPSEQDVSSSGMQQTRQLEETKMASSDKRKVPNQDLEMLFGDGANF